MGTYTITCIDCGIKFDYPTRRRTLCVNCSVNAKTALRSYHKNKKTHSHVCPICDTVFIGRSNKVYCSDRCAYKGRGRREYNRKKHDEAFLSKKRASHKKYRGTDKYRETSKNYREKLKLNNTNMTVDDYVVGTKKVYGVDVVIKEKDRIKRNEYMRKYRTDNKKNICSNLRTRIWCVLTRSKTKKSKSLECLIGCTIPFLIEYIESKFTKDMSWDNYGYYGWHIDHIIPCSSFDVADIEQQKKCFHYTNLQPLWAFENLSKKDKIITVVSETSQTVSS
jgi:hypothetical protein